MKKNVWIGIVTCAAAMAVGCATEGAPDVAAEELRAGQAPAEAAVVAEGQGAGDCAGDGVPARAGESEHGAAAEEPACDHEVAEVPSATRQVVPTGDSPRLGPERAPVVVVVSSDFQCPYCARAHGTIRRLQEMYGERIAIVFKHNPLPFHRHATEAALAAEAAGRQGRFWEMADLLFAHQDQLDHDGLLERARELRLDLRTFERDLDSPELTARLRADQELTQSLGARGTPTFWVNGRRIVGAQPIATFRAAIEEELTAPTR